MQAIDSTTGRPPPKEATRGGAHGAAQEGAHAGPDRLRNLAMVCAVFFVVGFVGVFGNTLVQFARHAAPGQSAPNDISIFWAAAKLALEGAPAAAFDLETLTAARNLPHDLPPVAYRMAWSYPPQFHALILPLGLMPFLAAWILLAVVGIAAFWIAMRRLIPDSRIVTVACASPAVLMCAIQGQTSLIVGALLAGFLVTLRAERPASAGLLLGALTIKPQFGPLLPLALLSAGAGGRPFWSARLLSA